MKLEIKKWGNSQGVVIPKSVLNTIEWQGEALDLKVENGRIIISKSMELDGVERVINEFNISWDNDVDVKWNSDIDAHIYISDNEKVFDYINQIISEEVKEKKGKIEVIELKGEKNPLLEEVLSLDAYRKEVFNDLYITNCKNYLEYNNSVQGEKIKKRFIFVEIDDETDIEVINTLHLLVSLGRPVGMSLIVNNKSNSIYKARNIEFNCNVKILNNRNSPYLSEIPVEKTLIRINHKGILVNRI